jgi:hypothetical protein
METRIEQFPDKAPKDNLRFSPERKELLERTLAIRKAIGRVNRDSTELVREMRDDGA